MRFAKDSLESLPRISPVEREKQCAGSDCPVGTADPNYGEKRDHQLDDRRKLSESPILYGRVKLRAGAGGTRLHVH
jgi:hypothetical protein